MLTRLRLERFKNFREAELHLGPLTLLIGTNASGKSNIRDALRFLHGISRGYSLAEIMGEKWVEGGVLQWRGIRGGTREVTFQQADTFALEVTFRVFDKGNVRNATYRIEVDRGTENRPPRVVAERLLIEGRGQHVFDSHPGGMPAGQADDLHLPVNLRKEKKGFIGPTVRFLNSQPVLSQIKTHPDVKLPTVRALADLALETLASMRFLDLSPDAMRAPSFPGQVNLGDRGENLSSVLQAICESPELKRALVEWVRDLTPLDAKDFEFASDQVGRILVTLVEENGHKTSAYSASDGTLRFLGMIAALLGPKPARFYFIEELENGIHPTRLDLLLDLIEHKVGQGEHKVGQGSIQIVATSHSPQLLSFLSRDALEHASLVYRLPGQPDARIRRILDIPDAQRLIREQTVNRLFASGWFEDAVAFLEGGEGQG